VPIVKLGLPESYFGYSVAPHFCKGAGIKHFCFDVQLVINFHSLSRGNVSITQQPQPGCVQFRQIMSRDHVIVIHFRKQKKPSFLQSKKKKMFFHKDTIKDMNAASICCTCLVFLILSFTISDVQARNYIFRIFSRSSVLSNNFVRKQDWLKAPSPATV